MTADRVDVGDGASDVVTADRLTESLTLLFGSGATLFRRGDANSDGKSDISDAVYGMIPKNKLGRKMLTKLKVYRGSEHPHSAQQPEEMAL